MVEAVIDQGMSPEGSLVKVTPVLLPQQQKSAQGQGLCTGNVQWEDCNWLVTLFCVLKTEVATEGPWVHVWNQMY